MCGQKKTTTKNRTVKTLTTQNVSTAVRALGEVDAIGSTMTDEAANDVDETLDDVNKFGSARVDDVDRLGSALADEPPDDVDGWLATTRSDVDILD